MIQKSTIKKGSRGRREKGSTSNSKGKHSKRKYERGENSSPKWRRSPMHRSRKFRRKGPSTWKLKKSSWKNTRLRYWTRGKSSWKRFVILRNPWTVKPWWNTKWTTELCRAKKGNKLRRIVKMKLEAGVTIFQIWNGLLVCYQIQKISHHVLQP
jgi:hypothetical protein